MEKFASIAAGTVFGGMTIPAHDMTFDIAESIGNLLDAFQGYVASVRDEEQAEDATAELLTAFLRLVKQPEHTFRVTHEYSGRIAYEGESYTAAAGTQYRENVEEQAAGLPPLWRLWLVDLDGIAVRVNTQQ
jgi:uncharacterized protein YdbL (DUF1318 family)